jgi:hypothetical protein
MMGMSEMEKLILDEGDIFILKRALKDYRLLHEKTRTESVHVVDSLLDQLENMKGGDALGEPKRLCWNCRKKRVLALLQELEPAFDDSYRPECFGTHLWNDLKKVIKILEKK